MINIKNEVQNAYEKIKPYVRETLVDYSIPLSKRIGCQIFLKCENLQYTNSFKIRGGQACCLEFCWMKDI